MSEKQKTLRNISIVELVAGLIYIIEGFIVSSGKVPYFIAGAFSVITAICCYMAVNDSSKAKPATILLWITIIINLAGLIISLVTRAGGTSIGLAALDTCIAAYLIKLIKEIHG